MTLKGGRGYCTNGDADRATLLTGQGSRLTVPGHRRPGPERSGAGVTESRYGLFPRTTDSCSLMTGWTKEGGRRHVQVHCGSGLVAQGPV